MVLDHCNHWIVLDRASQPKGSGQTMEFIAYIILFGGVAYLMYLIFDDVTHQWMTVERALMICVFIMGYLLLRIIN